MTKEDDLRREIDLLKGKVEELSEQLDREPLRELAIAPELKDISDRLARLTAVLDNLRAGQIDTRGVFRPLVDAIEDLRPRERPVDPAHEARIESAERLARALQFRQDDPDADFEPFPGAPAPGDLRREMEAVLHEER